MQLLLVDNNPEPSARPIYGEFYKGKPGYVHSPRPGIPMARNAAIEAALRADAQYIAFLDDDEVAPEHWLMSLLEAVEASGADAVQGGVRQCSADAMALASCDSLPEDRLTWEACGSLATCNVLFRAWLVQPPLALRFDETMQFTGGSDREFFMRARKCGAGLVRVHGADVLEEVAEGRETLRYRATRSYAAGSNYFTRMSKNEPGAVAAMRIVLRALEGALRGIVQLVHAAALLLALRPQCARRRWRDGCASLCFAAGCLTPVAGVRAYPYRRIRGT